jgi:hypothetical protein
MNSAMGHRVWAIPEGYIPGSSTGPQEMTSHESACFLNTSDEDAQVDITVYSAIGSRSALTVSWYRPAERFTSG